MEQRFSLSQVIFTSAERIIDTHCHYNLEPLYEDWQKHWEKAQAHGVVRSCIPGTDLETSRRAVAIAQQVPEFQAFVGIHPGSVTESAISLEETLAQLEQMLQSDAVIGVGEIGLDYFRITFDDLEERERQRAWLRAQVQLAQKFDAPVVLHVRDKQVPEAPTSGNAYWDVLQVIEETQFTGEMVLHCASGPRAYVQQMIEKGAYVSFAANITYPNAQAIRGLLAITPREKILCETDAPFLPPQEFRGQVCEPWMIQQTAEFLNTILEERLSFSRNKVQ